MARPLSLTEDASLRALLPESFVTRYRRSGIPVSHDRGAGPGDL
jgi:hypothetical protein